MLKKTWKCEICHYLLNGDLHIGALLTNKTQNKTQNEGTNRTDIIIYRSSARVSGPNYTQNNTRSSLPNSSTTSILKYLFNICLFDDLKHNTGRELEFEFLKARINI